MASFLYKPAFDGAPMQIMAVFDEPDRDLESEWVMWLEAHEFPPPIVPFRMDTNDRDYHVWVPSENHFIEHRLRWGGTVAKYEE